ncbi:hypothetical protein [Hymenobacter sedentarius]|uniref:hypothetical protein n=1 Tax=Hymenobacter sedentarius TaxID=1411621 RepID=UPI000ACE7931|nr:hypothetical protein [Hymenobacter sedentarius]
MKPTPISQRPVLQADPKIVAKVRRDDNNAAPNFFGTLRGEQDQEYLLPTAELRQTSWPQEFGRPGLR